MKKSAIFFSTIVLLCVNFSEFQNQNFARSEIIATRRVHLASSSPFSFDTTRFTTERIQIPPQTKLERRKEFSRSRSIKSENGRIVQNTDYTGLKQSQTFRTILGDNRAVEQRVEPKQLTHRASFERVESSGQGFVRNARKDTTAISRETDANIQNRRLFRESNNRKVTSVTADRRLYRKANDRHLSTKDNDRRFVLEISNRKISSQRNDRYAIPHSSERRISFDINSDRKTSAERESRRMVIEALGSKLFSERNIRGVVVSNSDRRISLERDDRRIAVESSGRRISSGDGRVDYLDRRQSGDRNDRQDAEKKTLNPRMVSNSRGVVSDLLHRRLVRKLPETRGRLEKRDLTRNVREMMRIELPSENHERKTELNRNTPRIPTSASDIFKRTILLQKNELMESGDEVIGKYVADYGHEQQWTMTTIVFCGTALVYYMQNYGQSNKLSID